MTENLSEIFSISYDQAKPFLFLKKEQIEQIECDPISKKGLYFFCNIKEYIENEYWLKNILNSYEVLFEALIKSYNQEESALDKTAILTVALSYAQICVKHFPSDTISNSEIKERIDALIGIPDYMMLLGLIRRFDINIDITRADLDSFFSYLVASYENWVKVFPFGIPHYKDLKENYNTIRSNEFDIEKVKLYEGSLDVFFKEKTIEILNNNNTCSLDENDEPINVQVIKRALNIASYKVGLSALQDNRELTSTIKVLKEWIILEENFIEKMLPFPKANQSEQSNLNFENKFGDNLDENTIYSYFKINLVETGLLSDENLKKYLKCAFEDEKPPNEKFRFKKNPSVERIYKIFYIFYKEIAYKPSLRKPYYEKLLGDYFEGFDSRKVSNNFR